MDSEAGFDYLYKSVLSTNLEAIENQRKRAHLTRVGVIVAFILMIIIWKPVNDFLISNRYSSSGEPSEMLLKLTLYAVVALGGLYFGVTRKYKNDFKNKIVKNIINEFGKDFSYDPDGMIPLKALEISRLFGERSYEGSDFVEGYLGETHIKFEKIHTGISGVKSTAIFFMANFNKDFNGETYLHSKQIPGFSAAMVKNPTFENYPPVLTDNASFNKEFNLYSSDPTEALYILSPALLEKITHLKALVQDQLSISFIRSYIFVTFRVRSGLFEPTFSKPTDEKTLSDYYHYMSLIFGMIESFKLNR
jgi:hypothetical protein